MKEGDSIVKKSIGISMILIYLLIALTYILYLPKYNPLRSSSNYTRVNSALVIKPLHHMQNSASGIIVRIHQAYRTIIENKKLVFTVIPQTFLTAISLLAGSILITYLLHIFGGNLQPFHRRQRTYLSCCILRI